MINDTNTPDEWSHHLCLVSNCMLCQQMVWKQVQHVAIYLLY